MQTKQKVLSFLVVGVVAAGVFGGFYVNTSDLMTKVLSTKIAKDLPVTRAELAAELTQYIIAEDEDLSEWEGCALKDTDLPDDSSSICYIINKGIMSTDESGYFSPNQSMPRFEAAKYFSEAYDYLVSLEYLDELEIPDVCTDAIKNKKASCMYKDVKDSDDFSYDIATLVVSGITDVKPYKGKSFNLNKIFTKSQFKIWDKNFKNLLGV